MIAPYDASSERPRDVAEQTRNQSDSAHRSLPRGYRLDIYQLEMVLGTPGAFGITYAALDRNDRWVAIKELFPVDHVFRSGTDTVVAQTTEQERIFRSAMDMFRREAQILGKIRHPNVIRVLDYLETNGTGYMVMEYHNGFDLGRHLKTQRPGRLNENELIKLLMPLLDGMEAVHNLDYLHRDIKPSNIYLAREDHNPLLLDFGAAHQVVVSRSRPITQILTPPYAPIEQWGHSPKMGPYTDIHAMGVVLFEAMLADHDFPNAPDRLGIDPFIPMARQLRGQEYSHEFLEVVDWALQVHAKDRPQTVQEWRKAFQEVIRRKVDARQRFHDRKNTFPRIPPDALKIGGLIIGVVVLAILIWCLLVWFSHV